MNTANTQYYPVFLDLSSQRCLVVGGGAVAERKVRTLLRSGALVEVISPTATRVLAHLAGRKKIQYRRRAFQKDDLDGQRLVIAATSDHQLNEEIAREARRRRILVNAVDQPQACDFIAPSIFTRGKLCIAISTRGGSPAMAKWLRRRLGDLIGSEYQEFLQLLALARRKVMARVPQVGRRKQVFERLIRSPVFSLLQQGKRQAARREFHALVERWTR